MAEYRYVHTRFWEDPDMLELTKEQRLFYLYLLTNPKSSQCGISEFVLKLAVPHTGFSEDELLKLIDVFENEFKKIRYNPKTHEIAVKNWGKYNYLTNNVKVRKHIKTEFAKVKDKELIKYVGGDNYLVKAKEKKEVKMDETDTNFSRTWKDFKTMRIKIRKPMTERAEELLLQRLKKLDTNEDKQIAILNQSIMNSWQGVFPLKVTTQDEEQGGAYEKHPFKKRTREEIDKSRKTGRVEIDKMLKKLKHQPRPESKGKEKMPMKEKNQNP